MSKLTLFIVATMVTVSCFAQAATSKIVKGSDPLTACRISQVPLQGHRAFVLENALIKVAVVPSSSGKILNYIFKATGEELFQPLKEETIEFADPPMVIRTNYAGFKDMIWEHGFNSSSKNYQLKKTTVNPDQASIEIVWRGKEYFLTRKVSIFRNSTEVRVDVKITSLSDKTQKLSYWSQTPVRVVDVFSARPTQMIPVRHVEKTDAVRKRAFHKGPDEVLIQPVPPKSTNYPLVQPWWGLRNPKSGLIMGQVFPSLEAFQPDGFLYTWCNKILLTQEPVFASRSFKPHQSRTYTVSFVTVDGLSELAYLSRNLAVELTTRPNKSYKKGADITVAIKAAAPRYVAKAVIKLVLKNSQGKIFNLGQGQQLSLSPLKPLVVTLKAPLQVTVGTYQLGLQLISDKKIVETAILLGHTIEVK